LPCDAGKHDRPDLCSYAFGFAAGEWHKAQKGIDPHDVMNLETIAHILLVERFRRRSGRKPAGQRVVQRIATAGVSALKNSGMTGREAAKAIAEAIARRNLRRPGRKSSSIDACTVYDWARKERDICGPWTEGLAAGLAAGSPDGRDKFTRIADATAILIEDVYDIYWRVRATLQNAAVALGSGKLSEADADYLARTIFNSIIEPMERMRPYEDVEKSEGLNPL
jgi:hypothetical protein